MVANKFLEEVDMDDNIRAETVIMCKHFHESVRTTSERFYETLRRRNYVTPTSYLELILTFKRLLDRKRDEIMLLKTRYLTGLEKLEFAASQVTLMQAELVSLQPQLIQTSEETEKLMITIEQDTVEVEATKEVSLSHNVSVSYHIVQQHMIIMSYRVCIALCRQIRCDCSRRMALAF